MACKDNLLLPVTFDEVIKAGLLIGCSRVYSQQGRYLKFCKKVPTENQESSQTIILHPRWHRFFAYFVHFFLQYLNGQVTPSSEKSTRLNLERLRLASSVGCEWEGSSLAFSDWDALIVVPHSRGVYPEGFFRVLYVFCPPFFLSEIDKKWSRRLQRFARKKEGLSSRLYYLSSVGGGWSAVRRVDQCVIYAAKCFMVGKRLSDEVVQKRCCLYLGYFFLWSNRFCVAKEIFDHVLKYAEEKAHVVLVRSAECCLTALQVALEKQHTAEASARRKPNEVGCGECGGDILVPGYERNHALLVDAMEKFCKAVILESGTDVDLCHSDTESERTSEHGSFCGAPEEDQEGHSKPLVIAEKPDDRSGVPMLADSVTKELFHMV